MEGCQKCYLCVRPERPLEFEIPLCWNKHLHGSRKANVCLVATVSVASCGNTKSSASQTVWLSGLFARVVHFSGNHSTFELSALFHLCHKWSTNEGHFIWRPQDNLEKRATHLTSFGLVLLRFPAGTMRGYPEVTRKASFSTEKATEMSRNRNGQNKGQWERRAKLGSARRINPEKMDDIPTAQSHSSKKIIWLYRPWFMGSQITFHLRTFEILSCYACFCPCELLCWEPNQTTGTELSVCQAWLPPLLLSNGLMSI